MMAYLAIVICVGLMGLCAHLGRCKLDPQDWENE